MHIIAHACNDAGKWGRGFVLAVSARWPHVREAYRAEPYPLGCAQLVYAERDIYVANHPPFDSARAAGLLPGVC